jgi:hypothetical protein
MSRPFEDDPRFRAEPADGARATDQPAGRRVRVVAGATGTTEASRAWQQQMARLERLQQQIDDLDALALDERERRSLELHPLQRRWRELTVALAHALAGRLEDKSLSERQREVARERVCTVAARMADGGDAGMRELHDRHSPRSWEQRRRDAAQDLRLQMEARLGQGLDLGDAPPSPELVWQIGREKLRDLQDSRREQRQERAHARQARRASTAAREQAQAEAADADQMLRQIYRQLASAWHPDRETDERERRRKTELMGQANAAYERRDLLSLLRLQGQGVRDGVGAAGHAQADERLAAMTLLLKRQVADRERARAALQSALALEFDLPPGQPAQPQTLAADRQAKREAMQLAIRGRERDLRCLDEGVALRRWLNAPWMG